MRKILLVLPALFFISVVDAQVNKIVSTKKDSFYITWQHKIILSAKLAPACKILEQSQILNGAVYYTITITGKDLSTFELTGSIEGSDESMACQSESPDNSLKIVRHVVGRSNSLLNNAVYERKSDWLLSFDSFYPKIKITPSANSNYDLKVDGWEIVIRFRPDYYKKHRGLNYFNPAEYTTWKKSVTGWCSWFAFFDKITEADVKETADVISEKLKPFGLNYLQIDDGYQQSPIGLPASWLQPNKKFPSGLEKLASYIKSKGLVPGIWTNVSFADSTNAFNNKNLFVKNNQGNPASGNWIGYVMDGSNDETIKKIISPVYSGLKKDGWQYYKLDALRHLKYEGYNSYADYFKQKHVDRNNAFRHVVKTIRKEIGKDNFLLACWGIRPELVGLADGCRIGNDGYSYAGLAQFNSYNNIIWRNDPDHIELSEKEAYRSCIATSLTGSIFMLTDKPAKYKNSPLIEAAKRSIPVLYTQPGQVYDVDPSKSSPIHLADIEMSGSGPRPFDASSSTTTGLFSLEISKPFEDWLLLGRLDDRDKIIPFKDLGLASQKDYLIFEFWTKKFVGVFQNSFAPDAIDTNYKCQVFCLREKLNYPQLLATNRHISCGGFDLKDVKWENNNLTGVSETVPGDDYIIYIYEPENFNFDSVSVINATLKNISKDGSIRKITLQSIDGNNEVSWHVLYK